ncbi:hypothetical protein Pelo_14365 [Pelomyxa schiedti]|nr:hypothetical protein Pelo_14365 [Pelomyxa schiedti]
MSRNALEVRGEVVAVEGWGTDGGGELYCQWCTGDAACDVVYFPGDIQTMRDEMNEWPEWQTYNEFCFEIVAALLSRRFCPCNVFIVRPKRYDDGFSFFDELISPGIALLNLQSMIRNAKINFSSTSRKSPQFEMETKLVAFSRGGLFMNLLLSELSTAVTNHTGGYILDWEVEDKRGLWEVPLCEDPLRIQSAHIPNTELLRHSTQVLSFFSRVSEIHWVDCHRYPTNPSVVDIFVGFLQRPRQHTVSLFVHTSPYMTKSETDPYIPVEHETFRALLQHHFPHSNATLTIRQYLQEEDCTLNTHFQTLQLFLMSNTE